MPASADLVEIGAGRGALGARLAARFRYLGFESDATSGAQAHQRVSAANGRVVIGLAEEADPNGGFDALVAFEVLEHLEDDAAALRTWAGWLRPGGRLVISVPAGPRRFGPADVAVGHYRRYSRAGLQSLLEGAGFEPIRTWTYGWPLGYLLEFVRNRLASRAGASGEPSMERRTATSGRWMQPRDWAAPITWLATLPFRVLQRPFAQTPFGTGLVAAARWPGPR